MILKIKSFKQLLRYGIHRMIPVFVVLLLGACLSDKDIKPDMGKGLPIKPARTLSLKITEGTFMNLDVSPDGAQIVFDLLGDIYLMPITGGEATQITRGLSWDTRPVWSPDGTLIAYKSDFSGINNAWVIHADGSAAQQITAAERDDPLEMEWVDAKNIVMPLNNSKDSISSVSDKSLKNKANVNFSWGPGQIHSFSNTNKLHIVNIGFIPKALTKNIPYYDRESKNPPKAVGLKKPNNSYNNYTAISSDGKWRVTAQQHERYDFGNGKSTSLVALNTKTKEEHALIPYNSGFKGRMARFSFLGDSEDLIISYGGKFYKINVLSGKKEHIPFSANPKIEMGDFVYNKHKVSEQSPFFKNIHSADLSPDGKTLVFSVNRKMYLYELKDRSIKLLIEEATGQFQPRFSPDGKAICYSTWDDMNGGDVRVLDLSKTAPKILTETSGFYLHPNWSPDGKSVGVIKSHSINPSFHIITESLGTLHLISVANNKTEIIKDSIPVNNYFNFNRAGSQIHFRDKAQLIQSVDVNSKTYHQIATQGKEHAQYFNTSEVIFSPNEKLVAYVFRSNVYVQEVDRTGKDLLLVDSLGNAHGIQLTFIGGRNPKWENNGKTLIWLSANVFHQVEVLEALKTGAESAKKYPIQLKIRQETLGKVIALTNARIISMKGDEVLKEGTIVIEGNRIKDIGPSNTVSVPKNAFVRDCKGKTIVPGLIDMHMHIHTPKSLFPQNWWKLLANLSYGITTGRDPSISDAFGYQEQIQSGVTLGPRLYGTNAIGSSGQHKVTCYEDALALARHFKSLRANFFKIHDTWPRLQRQWMVKAAQQENLNITGHLSVENELGAYNLAMLQDGFTGLEHKLRDNEPVYDDVKQLLAKSGIWHTLTPIGVRYFWMQGTLAIKNDPREATFNELMLEKANNYVKDLDSASVSRMKEMTFMNPVKDAYDMMKYGANISVGSHGDHPGRGFHWEMWALQMGGFSPHEALRAATLVGAEGLGMQADLGSLEAGKLADLLILDKNPLEDIKNSLSASHVMKGGKLYKANTLDQVWPEKKKAPEWKYKGQ